MPLPTLRNATTPIVVPHYDKHNDVFVLRVVKQVQKPRKFFSLVTPKLTNSTIESQDSDPFEYPSHSGLYSSEGEPVPSFAVEVQTDDWMAFPQTKSHNTSPSRNLHPRFVYSDTLKQNVLEELGYVGFRNDPDHVNVIQPDEIPLKVLASRLETRKRQLEKPLFTKPSDVVKLPHIVTDLFDEDSLYDGNSTIVTYSPEIPPSRKFSFFCAPGDSWFPQTMMSSASKCNFVATEVAVPYNFGATRTELTQESSWYPASKGRSHVPAMFDSVIDQVMCDEDEVNTLEGESVTGMFGRKRGCLGLTTHLTVDTTGDHETIGEETNFTWFSLLTPRQQEEQREAREAKGQTSLFDSVYQVFVDKACQGGTEPASPVPVETTTDEPGRFSHMFGGCIRHNEDNEEDDGSATYYDDDTAYTLSWSDTEA